MGAGLGYVACNATKSAIDRKIAYKMAFEKEFERTMQNIERLQVSDDELGRLGLVKEYSEWRKQREQARGSLAADGTSTGAGAIEGATS